VRPTTTPFKIKYFLEKHIIMLAQEFVGHIARPYLKKQTTKGWGGVERERERNLKKNLPLSFFLNNL
jgi:hypothetical protein